MSSLLFLSSEDCSNEAGQKRNILWCISTTVATEDLTAGEVKIVLIVA